MNFSFFDLFSWINLPASYDKTSSIFRLHLTSDRDRSISFSILQDPTTSNLEAHLENINHDFADVSYVCGWVPTTKDTIFFDFCVTFVSDQLFKWPHLKRWFANIQNFDRTERHMFPDPEGSITPLMRKVDHISNLRLSDRNIIDRKVRWLFAGKQNRYKLYIGMFIRICTHRLTSLYEISLLVKLY